VNSMSRSHENRHEEDGASAVEYGLLVAAIAGAVIIVVFALGGFVLHDMFEHTCDTITSQASFSTSCRG
jgi:pilus assembly protein Flp/PilA